MATYLFQTWTAWNSENCKQTPNCPILSASINYYMVLPLQQKKGLCRKSLPKMFLWTAKPDID